MMKKRTQNTIPGELAPIEVPPDFPVAEAVFNTRGETPVTHAHIHNLFEIGYCYSGSGVFLIGSKIFTFKPGDAVIITSREVHLATGNPGGVTSWGFLNFDPAGLVARHMDSAEPCFALDHCCGEDFTNIVDGEKYPELCECIRRIVEERKNMQPDSRSMIRSMVWQLLLLIRRYHPEPSRKSAGKFEDIQRIAPALEWMNSRMDQPVTLAQLAGKCHTSIPNFRKLFYRAMGCAPRPYLIRMRLSTACSMLKNTDLAIQEIALRCGFPTLSNFNRQFQNICGTSPGAVRRGADYKLSSSDSLSSR
ncbi:MAG: helix-turn-helix transcriptional regulator [Lentisphaeria bacterium]|nr:helix-turn-helix transcriptional regulator [Lentisphaeria bacterium]